MSVVVSKSQKPFITTLTVASTLWSRLKGLLGTNALEAGSGLWIKPCNSVHMFGMKYALDIIFLDDQHRIVKIVENLRPWKLVKPVRDATSVLEVPAGKCKTECVTEGDVLVLTQDKIHAEGDSLRQYIMHLATNILLAAFYFRFVRLSYSHWQQSGSMVPLGLFFVNSLLMYLFLTRERSRKITKRAVDWFAALATVFFSLCLTPVPGTKTVYVSLSISLQLIGILCMLFSLLSLGRSFGVVAAVRKIKIKGVYEFVRHPLYTSELIFYIGFIIGNVAVINIVLLFGIMIGQYVRAVAEERLLSSEMKYKDYLQRVKYRFIPGLF